LNARTDKLTGLYLEQYFLKRLTEEIARCLRYKRPLALLYMEVDYDFFEPNYNVEWAMGYTLFKQLGPLILSDLRKVDLAGRMGGKGFCIFLPETPEGGAMIAAERLRKKVEEHWFLGDDNVRRVRVALSIGVATFPIHGKNPQELIDSGKRALLLARKDGGNKALLFPEKLYEDEEYKRS
jgi:diguanylate cyclase (GGDEF)-like protein